MAPKTDQQSRKPNRDSSDASSANRPLSDDELFHLLHTSRRRKAIQYLLEQNSTIHLSKLARHIAALEHDVSTTEVTQTQYQRVYIPLYQSHLPKLDEAGIVRYNQSRGLVEPTDQLDIFRPYLRPKHESEDNTNSLAELVSSNNRGVSDWYLIAACLSALLLVVTAVGWIPLFGEIVGGAIIISFLAANAMARRQKTL